MDLSHIAGLRGECNSYSRPVCALPYVGMSLTRRTRDRTMPSGVISMGYDNYLRGTTEATFDRDTQPVRPAPV